ncbi:MAG TPA: hypothetical protein DF984_07705 [Anaerolineaceae bacterium]|jgi:type II secretory pathway pseudopilin PulG|nr:hypothetical protein [Anaerolineaceae bacterium]
MEKKNHGFTLISALIMLILVTIIGSIIFLSVKINQTIDAAILPLQQANQTISTQISSLLHPTPTILPDPVTIIREVQSLARLETIQYTVEKVITAEVNQGVFGPLFGDKLLLVAHGMVIAGIDLSKISTSDFSLEGDTLHVQLPDPEVFVATLNNDESYIYDRTTGLFRKSDPELETSARQAAEEEIYRAAVEDGILEQAKTNAEIFLERFFNSLGYLHVIFK